MNDPIAYFDSSITQMHMIPRAELATLQREAMAKRFASHRQRIEMVRNLADRLGIDEVKDFDDIVPLFFAHTAFKSYPASLLDKKRFDLMTNWLQKLTTADLSKVDPEGCDSIEEWIDRLDAGSDLRVITFLRNDGHHLDHPEGRPRRLLQHAAVAPLPVPALRHRAHEERTRARRRRDLAELRERQARPPADGGTAQARVHRWRRIEVPSAVPQRDQHRPDVPREQAAGGGVAGRTRSRRDRPETVGAQGGVRATRGEPARGDGGLLRAHHRRTRRQARLHDRHVHADVRDREGPGSSGA